VTGNPRWTSRLRLTSNAVHVGAFLVAGAAAAAVEGVTGDLMVATVLAAIGVLLAYTVPIPLTPGSRIQVPALGVSVMLFIATIAVTGGINSTFVVMPVASIFLASFAGGVRLAAPITLVSIVGVVMTTVAIDLESTAGSLIRIPVIYLITAIAFSEVQRALASETERVDDLVLAVRTSTERRDRLEVTHSLLEDLLRIATSPDLNAVVAARDALRDIGMVVPDAVAQIIRNGEVNLARRGQPPALPATDTIPIVRGDQTIARLDLWAEGEPLTPKQRTALEATVEPVGLALENDAMVQQLARLAIQRERVRLARELHDDIAPSIASVGLALDMVLLSDDLDTEQRRNLDATRSNVTGLVESIRNRVQDLRADRTMSLVEVAHSLVAEVDTDGPTVIVDIDERTPPRPAIAMEISSLLTEAFRNAVTHSNGSLIRVTGRIAESDGWLAVEDNGVGFDADRPAIGRYGLIGMRERSGLISAELDVHSAQGSGTTVTITWRNSL
jgi:signal transduction histidine kinase